ncbi:MAG: MBL fold metallo-hydrolase [Verrucomicrobiales bacterium]|nr:MBL fold metallo-hydrolase [Verrucomicrobiales bacterium]
MDRLLQSLLFLVSGISLFALGACSNRLGPYQDLLVGEPSELVSSPRGREVQVTYLGTNGFLVRSHQVTIAIDPYFSRLDTRRILLNAPVAPDQTSISTAIRQARFPKSVDAWLVTHAHFDHLFDIPVLAGIHGGRIVTSRTGAYLSEASGISPGRISATKPGKVHHFGDARVTVLSARHDKALGVTPYPGVIEAPLAAPPSRPRDWRMGEPLAFLIELEGKRIYIESGGLPGSPPEVSDVDLAIVGVATPSSQARYAEAVSALNPRFVLPSHQDNFFIPVDRGFHFSTLADFPRILATHQVERLPGEVILMDYFQTWSLP